MKTKIFGKKIVNTYEVVDNLREIKGENDELKQVFDVKPFIEKHSEVEDWATIVPDIDGEIKYNNHVSLWSLGRSRNINISSDEAVEIEKEIYRADLNEMHVFTDKVVKERDEGKSESETRLAELIGDYNEQIITSNEEMTAYCKLHKLNPREADCEEVFKLVFPNKHFTIKNGAVYTNAQTVKLSVADFPSMTYGALNGSHEVTIDLPTANQIIGLGSATSATTSTR